MTVTGTVFKGHAPTSGPLIYLKTDVAGAPTDAEFTTLQVQNIADGLQCFNTLDLTMYVRSGGTWTTRLQHRRQNTASYVVWFDGTNYHGDSMTSLSDVTPGTNANTVTQAAVNALTSGLIWVKDISVSTVGTLTPKTNVLLVFENNGLLTFTNGAANIAYTATVTGAPIAAPFSGTIIAQGASVCDSFYQIPIDLTTDTNHQFNAIDVELTAESGTSTSNIVGVYSAIKAMSGAGSTYAMNPVLDLQSGYSAGGHCLEVDVNNNSGGNTNVNPILVNGNSNTDLDHCMIALMSGGGLYLTAMQLQNFVAGALLKPDASRGTYSLRCEDGSGNMAFEVRKRGTISTRQSATAASVTQTSTTLAVSLPVAEPNATYQVYAVPNWGTTVFVTSKTTGGFTINFGTAAPASATVDWAVLRADGS